jgi:hypothetical protein
VLAELGAWDLEPRDDADSLEAAAALCRSAGYWALPYPVAERLARPADLDADGLVVVVSDRPSAALDGIEGRWVAVTLDGQRSRIAGRSAGGRAFVSRLELSPLDADGVETLPSRWCCRVGRCSECWTGHWNSPSLMSDCGSSSVSRCLRSRACSSS